MGENIRDLKEWGFNEFVREGKCVVDFWASWCGPCRMLAPVLEEVAEEFNGTVRFGKVEVDDNSELAQKFNVMSVPTLLFFKNGKIVDRNSGGVSKEELIGKIEGMKKL